MRERKIARPDRGRARGFSIGFQFSRGRHVERIRELVRGYGREYDNVRLPENDIIGLLKIENREVSSDIEFCGETSLSRGLSCRKMKLAASA